MIHTTCEGACGWGDPAKSTPLAGMRVVIGQARKRSIGLDPTPPVTNEVTRMADCLEGLSDLEDHGVISFTAEVPKAILGRAASMLRMAMAGWMAMRDERFEAEAKYRDAETRANIYEALTHQTEDALDSVVAELFESAHQSNSYHG